MIDDFDIGVANIIQFIIVFFAAALLWSFVKKRPELRLWFGVDLALEGSFIFAVLFRWGFGGIFSLLDIILKLVASILTTAAVLFDYMKIYPRHHIIPEVGLILVAVGIEFEDIAIPALLAISIFLSATFYFAIRNYKAKKTPTYAFMAMGALAAIFIDVTFSLRYFLPEAAASLQIYVTSADLFLATIMLGFSLAVRAEVDIVRSREMKSNFLTFATHELKTPLIPIFGWADLLAKAAEKGTDLGKDTQEEAIESILRSANRLKTIVDRFLDVGMLESGRLKLDFEDVSLKEMVDESIMGVTGIAENKGISIQSDYSDVAVRVDRFRMEEVFINVLSNAIKYSPPDTQVTVRTAEKPDQNQIVILIKDQGFGFSDDELPEAMQPFSLSFFRKKGEQSIPSTGVGLFICKSIVENHGGKIEIESPGVNQGTIVRIFLPWAATNP